MGWRLELEKREAKRPVKGWFEQTLPATKADVGEIALLRLDCDWHASITTCLEEFYDQVVPGGLILVDDYYTFDGCAIAVHEFLARRRLVERITTDAQNVVLQKQG